MISTLKNLQIRTIVLYYIQLDIKKRIYTVREKHVMLDCDVAMLYNYETKNVNKAMKRNIERFLKDFCFQLTGDELHQMWFHFGTTFGNAKYRSEKYLPYVYTEQEIAMLARVLKSESKMNKFHDRFIIIDNKELFHCGASIKDLGKKCFGINKMEDKSIIRKLLNI